MSFHRRSIADEFGFAADRVWDLPESLSNDDMLSLYGLYVHQIIKIQLIQGISKASLVIALLKDLHGGISKVERNGMLGMRFAVSFRSQCPN